MYNVIRFKDRSVEGDLIKVEALGRYTLSIWAYEGVGEDRQVALVDLDRASVVALRDVLTHWLEQTEERRSGIDRRAKA